MKNNFIFLTIFSLLFFVGCGQSNRTNVQSKDCIEKKYALQLLIDSCLTHQPNAMNNDVSRSMLADTIRTTIQQFIGDTLPFLADIPLQYEMCLEYPNDSYSKNAGKYVVKFGFGEHTSKCKLSDDYKTTFQIFTIMEKAQVAQLVDNALYRVNGVFVDFANNSQKTGFILPSGKCLIDYPTIMTIENKPYIDLGTLIIENTTCKKIGQN